MWPFKIAEEELDQKYFAHRGINGNEPPKDDSLESEEVNQKNFETKYGDYYKKSWKKYSTYNEHKHDENYNHDFKRDRQWEKDERIWTAITLTNLFEDSLSLQHNLEDLLVKAYGAVPPIKRLVEKPDNAEIVNPTWKECLKGDMRLFLEANLPAPEKYKIHLSHNLDKTNFIPYIQDWASKDKNGKPPFRKDLEGATDVDALIINTSNGFSIFIEAKVLADISTQVTYDMKRNQIARNLDVILNLSNKEADCFKRLDTAFKEIDSEASLFMLLTPQVFKNDWRSRLYGYKYWDYKNNPLNIKNDLPHLRTSNIDWNYLSDRIGWITWEDIRKKNAEEIVKEQCFKEVVPNN